MEPQNILHILSPDGSVELSFALFTRDGAISAPFYNVKLNNQPLIKWSRLGLKMKGKRKFSEKFKIAEINQSSHSEEWVPVYGERAQIPNNYNQAEICLAHSTLHQDSKQLYITFRVFNEGIGFRYHIPAQKKLLSFTIKDELTQFSFPHNSWCYEEHGSEGEYQFCPILQTKKLMERPLTVIVGSGTKSEKYLVISDANVREYSPFRLSRNKRSPNTLQVSLGASRIVVFPGTGIFHPKHPLDIWKGQVKAYPPFSTAWRVIIIGEKPGDLIEQNYLIQNLCPPNKIQNVGWIKPGKVIRDMKMTNESGRQYIDFAVEHGIDYVHWDAGWYGPEHSYASDPTTISVDRKKYPKVEQQPEFDFHSIISYAKEKGIGVWVYVNYRHLELYLDEILPLYKQWGIDGIKFGFVRYGPHQCQKWLINAVEKCANHQIMVDIHDAYRPSGLSRTLPNLLTQEGIRGNEHRPTATHSCTVPFTRFSTGAADFTISYYSNKIQTTHAHQLALSIIYYSPLQFLFWYDNPSHYQGEPELEFFKRLPTIWDETKVLDGKIGHFVTIARRNGRMWFIGGITNESPRTKHIVLNFLDSSLNYSCVSYFDDFSTDTATQVGILRKNIMTGETMEFNLPATGGFAMICEPVENFIDNKEKAENRRKK